MERSYCSGDVACGCPLIPTYVHEMLRKPGAAQGFALHGALQQLGASVITRPRGQALSAGRRQQFSDADPLSTSCGLAPCSIEQRGKGTHSLRTLVRRLGLVGNRGMGM